MDQTIIRSSRIHDFASAAMNALIASKTVSTADADRLAEEAYRIALAMEKQATDRDNRTSTAL